MQPVISFYRLRCRLEKLERTVIIAAEPSNRDPSRHGEKVKQDKTSALCPRDVFIYTKMITNVVAILHVLLNNAAYCREASTRMVCYLK